ncbi:hypothetical protein H2203_000709 [Taxawa tesnikishii (nom. ined.)]|nr:hypothetical protein H2203_000709 [Dothideales sp. JES 119]
MSGYLPPHYGEGEGQCSEIYQAKYDLKPTDISGGSEEIKDYWLGLPEDVIPTVNTLITIADRFRSLGLGDVLSYGWGPSGGYDQKLNDDSIHGAWKAIFQRCTNVLLDTAEHYGYTDGYSEKKVGDFWSEEQTNNTLDRSRIVLATKYFPTPWRHPWRYPNIVLEAFSGSIQRTRLGNIDIYQLHGPSHWGYWPRLDTLCDALVKAYKTGQCKAIGTCNLSFQQVKSVYTILKRHNVPYVSNQVEFSLVRQDPWTCGMIEKCHKLGIVTIAYSPIALGRLSGKYSNRNHPRGNRNFGHIQWDKIQPIVDELTRIGAKEGKTPSAVALNWVICKGAIPIPTVKNRDQVTDNLQALGWRLSKEDENRLDVLGLTNSPDWYTYSHFQNWWWQQG